MAKLLTSTIAKANYWVHRCTLIISYFLYVWNIFSVRTLISPFALKMRTVYSLEVEHDMPTTDLYLELVFGD